MGLFKKTAVQKALLQEARAKEHTILIVDDEEHNLVTLADLLSDEYNVLTALNGVAALELIKEQEDPEAIHLIISDQRMPKLKGVEFLHETLDIIPNAKRILLTGFTDVEAIINSINKGQIYKFVLKPFDHRDMLMTVKLALDTYELESQNDELIQELTVLNTNLEKKVVERTYELQEALKELSDLNASKDRFFSVLAHDLKNPLHAFILTAETIVEDIEYFSKGEISKLATNLYKGSQNLYRLLENLLYWAQRQLEEGNFHPTVCELHKVAEQVIDIAESQANQKNINILNQMKPGRTAYVDKNMLEVILRNLISNGIKFSQPNTNIRLLSQENGRYVSISVEDQGVGIDEEGLERLFRVDKYYTSRGTNNEKGTGLGLILCKELVGKNGGKISVESEVGKGTTFTFTLPKEPPVAMEEPPTNTDDATSKG